MPILIGHSAVCVLRDLFAHLEIQRAPKIVRSALESRNNQRRSQPRMICPFCWCLFATVSIPSQLGMTCRRRRTITANAMSHRSQMPPPPEDPFGVGSLLLGVTPLPLTTVASESLLLADWSSI